MPVQRSADARKLRSRQLLRNNGGPLRRHQARRRAFRRHLFMAERNSRGKRSLPALRGRTGERRATRGRFEDHVGAGYGADGDDLRRLRHHADRDATSRSTPRSSSRSMSRRGARGSPSRGSSKVMASRSETRSQARSIGCASIFRTASSTSLPKSGAARPKRKEKSR